MSTPAIKPDPEVKREPSVAPSIKPDPYADDDSLYEDAGDLDLSTGNRDIWLVKLPQYIAERWRDIDDDEEITLGVVKIPPPDRQSNENGTTKLKLVLERNETNGMETPTDYELQITNMEVTNTYVFTEKDMPGYESRGMGKPGEVPIPSRLLYQNQRSGGDGHGGGKKDWKNQRHQPYFRKAIPSMSLQTCLWLLLRRRRRLRGAEELVTDGVMV